MSMSVPNLAGGAMRLKGKFSDLKNMAGNHVFPNKTQQVKDFFTKTIPTTASNVWATKGGKVGIIGAGVLALSAAVAKIVTEVKANKQEEDASKQLAYMA